MTYRNLIKSGTLSNLPPGGAPGRLYLPTDGAATYENNGTTWQTWAPTYSIDIPTASNTNFGWINQGTSTKAYNSCGILVTVPGAAGASPSIVQNNSNTTSGFVEASALSMTTGILIGTNAYISWGPLFYNASNGNYLTCTVVFDINNGSNISFLNYTGTNVAPTNNSLIQMSGPVFLKMTIVGSNIVTQLSRDRINYAQIFSVSLSTALGTGLTSNTFQVGVRVISSGNSAYTNYTNIFHYTQG